MTQSATTTIIFSIDPHADARKAGGVVKQARLGGEVVWCSKRDGQGTVAFITQPQGLAIGLCMYRWCKRKAAECKRHAAVRGRGGC